MIAISANVLFVAWLSSQSLSVDNLDFASGTLKGWEGEGFALRKLPTGFVASSENKGLGDEEALLHRAFVVPENAGYIRFKACARGTTGEQNASTLDVVLFAHGKRIIPKQVKTNGGWQAATSVLRQKNGDLKEYIWPVSQYAGQTLRIALVDEGNRPDHYLICTGFQVLSVEQHEQREFSALMVNLTATHHLPPVLRYDSRHFTALSDADEGFSEMRLQDCETMYTLFYDHFRRKGFALRQPSAKLMVAIFDTQAGFEAYLGQNVPTGLTGMYHSKSNRFVMYDFGQNRNYVSAKRQAEQRGRQIGSQLDRQRYLGTLERRARDVRADANIGTIMHEVAHQISFNSGLLNREGDVPLWAAEGLACYCEATRGGTWQGIGEPDPERLPLLASAMRTQTKLMPVQELVKSERWLKMSDPKQVYLMYAESWALFSMLMEERPQDLRKYFELIYSRQTSERRVADFEQAFGTNWTRHDRKLEDYVQRIVSQFGNPRR
jgi:hypothetical protein